MTRVGRSGMVRSATDRAESSVDIEDLEEPRRRRHPGETRVKGRTEAPHGQIELGGEEQHEKGRLEAEPPAEQPQADLHRHHRNAQGRHQLEHQRRQKGDPQHRHGR